MHRVSLRIVAFTLTSAILIMSQYAHAAAIEAFHADADAFASPVSNAELDGSRGAYSPSVLNFNSLSATNLGNTVNGGNTGDNLVTGSSFNSTQGLVNVIQNSGNNVIIQSSTIVNMTFNK